MQERDWTLRLLLTCETCRQPVVLTYRPDVREGGVTRWQCPSPCGRWNAAAIPGRLVSVSAVQRLLDRRGRDQSPPPGLTLLTACPRCALTLELAFELRPSRDRLAHVRFSCPGCHRESRFQSGRRILWVAVAREDVDVAH